MVCLLNNNFHPKLQKNANTMLTIRIISIPPEILILFWLRLKYCFDVNAFFSKNQKTERMRNLRTFCITKKERPEIFKKFRTFGILLVDVRNDGNRRTESIILMTIEMLQKIDNFPVSLSYVFLNCQLFKVFSWIIRHKLQLKPFC